MLGQGRPTTSSRAARAFASRHTLAASRCAAPLFLAVVATCALADDATLRLRIAWGGGAERVWQGAIALDGGTLSDVQALGIEADEPGSIWIAGSDRVEIRQRSLRAYDGVDVTVSAARDARLSIHLSHEETPDPQSIEVSIGELIDQPYDSDLDDVGNRLSVSRSPGDRLRIEFDREHLVFAPGEPFTFQVEPHLIGASTSGLRLQAQNHPQPWRAARLVEGIHHRRRRHGHDHHAAGSPGRRRIRPDTCHGPIVAHQAAVWTSAARRAAEGAVHRPGARGGGPDRRSSHGARGRDQSGQPAVVGTVCQPAAHPGLSPGAAGQWRLGHVEPSGAGAHGPARPARHTTGHQLGSLSRCRSTIPDRPTCWRSSIPATCRRRWASACSNRTPQEP